jgi:flagellar protein FlbD
MIEVTKLNGKMIYVNPHLIETIENIEDNNPDTRINFFTGKVIIVKESNEEIIQKIIEYRRKLGINAQES